MDPVVILGSEQVSVGPGQERRVPVRIRNQGRRVESYRVDIVGAPATFAEVTPTSVSVLPGREAEVDVVFRPPGGASTPTGSLPFAIRATSEVDASSSAVAEGRVDLAGVAGLQAWAPETLRAGRWSAKYHLEFANDGNAAARLALLAHDPAGTTRLNLAPDTVDLPPGGRATAVLKVKTRQPYLRGSKTTHNIQVSCQTFPFGAERPTPGAVPPQGDPNHRTFHVMFEQRPVLAKFVIPLLVVATVAVLAFVTVQLRRGNKELALAMTNPNLPKDGVSASPAGPSSMILRWPLVPNAEGYEITQFEGPSGGKLPDAPLPSDQPSFQVDGLAASTKYCFRVKATGPDEQTSSSAVDACATTPGPTELPKPEIVSVDPTGDLYRVTWNWEPPAGVDETKVVYGVIVGGILPGLSTPAKTVEIPIPAKNEAYDAKVQVQAVLGDDKSPLSAEFPVKVPASVPATVATVPPTEQATTTVPAEAGGPTSVAVETTTAQQTTLPGATTSVPGEATPGVTTAPPTSSLPPPNDGTQLQNVEGTWVAMLGSAPAVNEGGTDLKTRKEVLARPFGLDASNLQVFTNRDTIVTDAAGVAVQEYTGAAPSSRLVYVLANNEAEAADICARQPTRECKVLFITGAARKFEGGAIAVIGNLVPGASMQTIDDQLKRQRASLGQPDIYVMDGAAYPSLGKKGPVLFVGGFQTTDLAKEFCTSSSAKLSQCEALPLPAS